MYKCESCTIKKAESQRTDDFKLWCWRRLLRVPWTVRGSNQPILKEINPKYSLEGLMVNWSSNTLATWCEETTTWKRPWCDGERLRAGEGDDRGWDGWMASLTQWTWVWGNSKRRWGTGKPGVLQSKGLQRVRHNLVTEQQQISNNNNYPKSSHEQIGNFFNSKGLSFLDFMLGDNML